jgi:hypothetical protein
MRRESKSMNDIIHSDNATRSHQQKEQSQTIHTEMAASDAVTQDPPVLELSAGEVSLEERHQLIAEAAYYHAAQRNFAPGNELEDWLNAEAEIERRLSQSS